ncbi:MAG: hypothetical protein JWP63_543 [Candidatus Solibacter sp.]|jgi:hypothetical protein|nr:hypothetical protein [Candidatus Solibacter sp.]
MAGRVDRAAHAAAFAKTAPVYRTYAVPSSARNHRNTKK